MKRFVICIVMWLGMLLFSHAQETAKIDSNYRNWYYDARQKLYDELKGTKYDVVFLGNSMTERGDWQELIGHRIAVANRGIGGDNTFGVLARLDAVTTIKPKKLFLMIGINDIGRGLPIAVISNNYRRIIKQITSDSPRTKIFLQSVLPMNSELLDADNLKGKEALVAELNKEIKRIADEEKLVFIDLWPVFSVDGQLKKDLTADGIHLKPEVYGIWVNHLKEKRYL